MIRTITVLAVLLALGACATAVTPVEPEQPDCVAPTETLPVDGGIGGTGNREEGDPCDQRKGRGRV